MVWRSTTAETLSTVFLVATLLGVSKCVAQSATTMLVSNGAASTQALQQDSNCTSTTCLRGVAYNTGYLAGCQVVVTSANYPNFTATTSLTGSFEFDFNPSLLVNATLLVPANQSASTGALLPNGTVYLCADTATNKPPPFTLAALLPSDVTKLMVINALTTAATQAATHLNSLPSCYQAALAQAAEASGVPILLPITPDKLFQLLSNSADGPGGVAALAYVNALANLTVRSCPAPVYDTPALLYVDALASLPDPVLAQLYVLNAQVLTIALEGGYGVLAEGVTGGLNADSAVNAMFQHVILSAGQQLYTRQSQGGAAAALDLSQTTGLLSLTDAPTLATELQAVNATADAAEVSGGKLCQAGGPSAQPTAAINFRRLLQQKPRPAEGMSQRHLLLDAQATVKDADAIYDTLADWTDYAALEAAYIGTELTAKTTAALNTVLTQAPAFASS